MSKKNTIIECPGCSKKIEYSTQNPNRPFCSDKCKLIDFGAWANEEYKVPVQEDVGKPFDEVES